MSPASKRDDPDGRRIALHSFLGASFLTAALLLPHAPALPIAGGVVLAAAVVAAVAARHRVAH